MKKQKASVKIASIRTCSIWTGSVVEMFWWTVQNKFAWQFLGQTPPTSNFIKIHQVLSEVKYDVNILQTDKNHIQCKWRPWYNFSLQFNSWPSPFCFCKVRCKLATYQPLRLVGTHHMQNTATFVSLCDTRLCQSQVCGHAWHRKVLSNAHTYNLLSWGPVISCIWWITATCSRVLLRQWLHRYIHIWEW